MTSGIFMALVGGLDGEIDFKPPIARVPVIVEQLAKRTGTKLEVGSKLTDEVVCIIAEKRTPREIMNQLAFALEANWLETNGRFILNRPANWDQVVKDRQIAAFRKRIEESVRTDPPSKVNATDEIVAQAKKERDARNLARRMAVRESSLFSLKTPAGRLLDGIIAELTPAGLAKAAIGHRVVFSNQPTKMQIQLPAKLQEAMKAFAARHNELTDAILPTIPADQPRFATNAYDTFARVNPETMKVLVVANGQTQRSISIRVYQEGAMAAVATRSLEPAIDRIASDAYQIKANKETIDFLRARKPAPNHSNQQILTEATLVKEFSKPTKSEFLRPGNSEFLAEIQRREARPLVAVLTDQMLARPYLLDDKGMLTMGYFESMAAYLGCSVQEHDGWSVMRPAVPAARLSRSAFETLIAASAQDGRITLDNWARLALLSDDAALQTASEVSALVDRPIRLEIMNDPRAVRFYGLLTEQQKSTLRKGILMADALTDAQKREVAAMMYDYEAAGLSRLTHLRQGSALLMGEPTEYLPNGITNPLRISAVGQDGEAWFGEFKGAVTSHWLVSPESTAWDGAIEARPDLFSTPSGINPLKTQRFYRGTTRSWNFIFYVDGIYDLGKDLPDETIDRSRSYSFAELPSEFREAHDKQVKQLIAQYEKLKAEGRLGTGTGKVPPP